MGVINHLLEINGYFGIYEILKIIVELLVYIMDLEHNNLL